VPLTPATEHLIGEAELRAMKRTAYLVNIARGRVIDTDSASVKGGHSKYTKLFALAQDVLTELRVAGEQSK